MSVSNSYTVTDVVIIVTSRVSKSVVQSLRRNRDELE